MIDFHTGIQALRKFKVSSLNERIQALIPDLEIIGTEFIHFIQLDKDLNQSNKKSLYKLLDYAPEVREQIESLPNLDRESVASWAAVMADWVLIIEKIPQKDLLLFDPDDPEIEDHNPAIREIFSRRFRKQEEGYAFLMNEIDERLKNETEKEKAERNEVFDRKEKEAVESFARIEKGIKNKFEDRVKEWKPLYPELKGKTKFPEDWTDEQWAENVKPWNKYQEIKAQRAKSIEGAADAAKKSLLYDRIRKRLESILASQA